MKKSCIFIALLWVTIATYAQTKASDDAHVQYTELIKNHSFEDEVKAIPNRRFGPNGEGELFGRPLPPGIISGWIIVNGRENNSKIETITENLLDETQHEALCWSISKATDATPEAIANVGNHGIEAVKGGKYTLSFWARSDKQYKGKIRVGLQNKSDGTWYAQANVRGKIKKKWKKYTITFTAQQSVENTRFIMAVNKPGTLYLDEVSLYSPDVTKR